VLGGEFWGLSDTSDGEFAGELFPERDLFDLGTRHRPVVDDADVTGDLEGGDRAETVGDDLVRGEGGTVT